MKNNNNNTQKNITKIEQPQDLIKFLKYYRSKYNYDALQHPQLHNQNPGLYLIVLYKLINPTWANEFKKIESKINQREYSETFDPESTYKNFGKDECMKELFTWHTANKLAHIADHQISILVQNELNELIKHTGDYNLSNRADSIDKNYLVRLIIDNTFTSTDIAQKFNLPLTIVEDLRNNLNAKDVKELVTFRQDAYFLKRIYTSKVLTRLSDPGNKINYGICYQPKQKPILVVDIPYHGQISTHITDPGIIQTLSKYPKYPVDYYVERETSVFPPDIISNEAKKYFNGKQKLSPQELIDIGKNLDLQRPASRRQSPNNFKLKNLLGKDLKLIHYLAIKSGYTQDDFNQLYFNKKTQKAVQVKSPNQSSKQNSTPKTSKSHSAPLTHTIQINKEWTFDD